MKQKTLLFSLGIFITFSSYSLINTQAVPFLTQLGYSPTQRGMVLSFVGLVSILGQIYVGFLSDKFGTVKKFFIYLSFIMVALITLSFIVQKEFFLFHFMFFGLGMGITRILVNLQETWIMEIDDLRPDFGFIRAFGSMGWALASLMSGYLILYFSFTGLAYLCAFFTLIFVFLSIHMQDAQKTQGLEVGINDIKLLFANRNYRLYLYAYFIAFFVYNADAITVTDLMISLGATPETVGLKWFLQAMSELPLLLIGGSLLIRFNAKKVMLLASVLMAIRMGLLTFAGSSNQVIIISLLQAVTYPLMLLTQKVLVYKELPLNLRSTGQMVAISLTAGLASVLMPLFSGIIVEMASIQTVLGLSALLMIVPIYSIYKTLT